MYVKSKCKELASSFDRNLFASEAKALHYALATATADYGTLKIGMGKMEDKYDTISSNRNVFEITKKTIWVMACLHVLHTLSGNRQYAEAYSLNKRIGEDETVPRPLRGGIAALAAKHRVPLQSAAKRQKVADPDIGEGSSH